MTLPPEPDQGLASWDHVWIMSVDWLSFQKISGQDELFPVLRYRESETSPRARTPQP